MMNPSRTTRRGDALGRNLGTPTANRSSDSESGSSIDQRALTVLDAPVVPQHEQDEHQRAGEDEPDDRGQPEPCGGFRLRLDEAPRPGLQDPKYDRAEPERGESRTHQVEPGAFLRRRVVHAAGQDKDHEHDDHLSGEHPSPRHVGVNRPPTSGPSAAAIAPAAATSP